MDVSKLKNPKAREYATEINAKHDQVKAIWDKIDAEGGREATKEELADVKKTNQAIEDLELKLTNLAEGEEMRQQTEQRRAAAQARRLPGGNAPEKGDGDEESRMSLEYRASRRSLGRQMTESDSFKAWLKTVAPNGTVGQRIGIQSPQIETRSLITAGDTTSGGAAIWSERDTAIVNAAPFQPLTLMDLISTGETTSNAVEYARITGYTNNAGPVGEATGSDDGSGAKPESSMVLEKVLENVKTLAHWIPATSRVLEDAAQLRSLIDNFLTFGLKQIAEYLMLNGDGTGDNFLGILNTPGIQTQAFDTDIITTTRKARTKARTPGRVVPTAYLLNPLDWEAFDLSKDGQGRYYWGGPSILGNPRLWGLPVVENESIAEGTGLTGDFKQAMYWDRMLAMISVSNSHADFYIRNLIAILAEQRAAFGVLYPKAFINIDLTA